MSWSYFSLYEEEMIVLQYYNVPYQEIQPNSILVSFIDLKLVAGVILILLIRYGS